MVEFLSQKNDASLFAFGSHTKKRPHNLVLGRLYEHQILDMIEVSIKGDTFKSLREFTVTREANVKYGMAPLIIFNGDDFENETKTDLVLLKNLLLDMFRGAVLDKLNLASLDRVIVCTAHHDTVFFRQYAILMKKSGTKYPRVELEEIGPSMDWKIGRTKSAPPSLKAHAMRIPKIVRKKGHVLEKNIETGPMGDRMARIHLEKQELDKMALKKMKGLKKKRKQAEGDEAEVTPNKVAKTDQ